MRYFLLVFLLIPNLNALYYDGQSTYSIYPRLDLQICANSSLSFDFTLSISQFKNSTFNKNPSIAQNTARILLYSEQQIQISTLGSTSKKLINSYFLIKYVQPNRLIVNDYWNINDVQIQLPNDYATSWFRFVYTRRSNSVDINLFKFESTSSSANNRIPSIRLSQIFSKQIIHSNFVLDEFKNSEEESLIDSKQVTYSKLFVGGVGENLNENNYALNQLKQLGKFHGYIMNLQYTSQATQCPLEICSKQSITQRQYAIFSLSPSKIQKSLLSDSVMIDDICESDTLTHDICPKDCSCLSNNLIAPYFNCDCADPTMPKSKCNSLFKSFALNLNDDNYFGNAEKFEYPILPSFTKIEINNVATQFDKLKGIQFRNTISKLSLSPLSEIPETDSCFWNIEDCSTGFTQHIVMSIERLDEKKFNSKVVLFQNGQSDMSKFVAFVYKNRLHFSLFEQTESQEWLVSTFPMNKHLNRQIKITITYLRDKYLSLHVDGFLVDMTTKPSSPPVNQDVYISINNLNRFYYEFGVRLIQSDSVKNIGSTLLNHQFTIKSIRRDYFNDPAENGQDSKILVSSPLPSEIIRIDNTQRVMYKIDSPLTSVTSETIELSFRTTQSDGVVFYIRNNPLITYFELVRGQPVIVIDTRVKNFYLRPQTTPLNDNQWHEIKLHRDGQLVSINIDSQYHDMCEMVQINNQILTGGYVYLGLADPNNINLSDKKTFVGEMVRGKVTINNVQQKVVQQPYYWPSIPATIHTTNQTVNIDTSQLTQDGKMINIVINVYGPPGLVVNAGQKTETETETHLIYLDSLPDTNYISVSSTDTEIDFRVKGTTRLDSFMIKFQTRQTCGQLVTLVNDRRNYIGIEIYDGYLYSSTSINGFNQRHQISRIRVDDGRIYQINIRHEQQKIMCWLESDDSYKQSIFSTQTQQTVIVNTIRIAGQDGINYGFSSKLGFIGCIGAIIFNERDVIDYQVVPSERRQKCQEVIHQPVTPAPPPPTTPAPPSGPVSLGYISFSGSVDILVYNYFYDHEKPLFEDISFIFRTVVSNGILFSAHNNEDNQNQVLVGAYLKEGLVHVVYKNYSYTHDLYFNSTVVDDGNLYRLNIRRNSNGHGFIQLQSYVGVTALEFYTQPGQIKFTKIIVGGADEWSKIKFFGHRSDFIGCIIDLFQINGNSVIKPADIPQERYNCNVERPSPPTTVAPPRPERPSCLPDGYPLSFSTVDDALTHQHETIICEHIHIPFKTRDSRGIIYSHSSDDGNNYILVYLRRGYVNIIVRDNSGERDLELDSVRVDDGEVHKLDIHCESAGYLIAYVDQNRQTSSNRIELSSPILLNTYTLGYYNSEILSTRYSQMDNFRGCLDQVYFNKQCLIFHKDADRNRLSCPIEPVQQTQAPTQPPKKQTCLNTCYSSDDCVFETDSRGFFVYNAYDAGAQVSTSRDSIKFSFLISNLKDQDQDLVSVYHPQRSLRVFVSNGELFYDLVGHQTKRIGTFSNLNDAKWHRIFIEQNRQELVFKVDDKQTSERIPIEFDLYGTGSIYFAASHRREANNLHGFVKDVYVKFSNVEYDVLASAKDSRIPGVTCEGHVVLKNFVEQSKPKLRCVSDPADDSSSECSTDGVCFASLWRNSSGVIERYMRCFNREQLQPPENPVLCRSQDLTRYVIQCCDTDYCNRDLQLKLKDLDEKDERSIWRFRGVNSGDIEFVPYLSPSKQSELVFQFNTSKPDGSVMCSKDDNYALRGELKGQNFVLSVMELRSKRILKTSSCPQRSPLNDNKWHKVQLIKKSRSQIQLVCDDSSPVNFQYEIDIPFVNTNKFGVVFGSDCVDEKGVKFQGDLSSIVYTHDSKTFSFDDLQYSEDPRFTYENYVEFRPKFITEIHSDPKPIFFRSDKSSARLRKWDDSKIGRISFEFKNEIPNENGILFSTDSADNYFAININDGYLETVLSPHRVPYADTTSNKISYYDRFQRLFPSLKINDGQWHKLEFMMLGDSIGSFVLDDDQTSKLRFPISYWNEESSITFGYNLDLKRLNLGSFRGCVRNVVINNRLINWLTTGTLYNIEAGCYNYRYEPNQLLLLQGQRPNTDNGDASTILNLNSNGCLRYTPKGNDLRETIEFMFKTGGDNQVLIDSQNSDFIVHTQGPSLVIRSRDDTNMAIVLERGVYFNDLNWHRIKLEKFENSKITIELDSKYKQEFILSKRTGRLGPLLLGCSKKNTLKLNQILKNFEGNLQNVYYSSNGNGKIDLIDKLNLADSSVQVDGQVQWVLNTKNTNGKVVDNSITFKDNSYLKLDNLRFDTNSNISFGFRTNENEGLLALIAPSVSSNSKSLSLVTSNYISVELTNGTVSLLVYLDKELQRVNCPSKMNDNKWHTISIKRDRLGLDTTPSLTFQCDNIQSRLRVNDQKLPSQVQFNSGNLSSESLPANLWLSKNSKFSGCIKNFRLNDRIINLYEQASVDSKQTLENGCKETTGFCRNSKCLNQGECVEGFLESSCNCYSTSYTGRHCDQLAPTLSFNGSHTVEFLLNEPVQSSSEEISLRFRTGLRNGVLFSLKKSIDEPSVVISLEDGRVKCVYDRNDNDKAIYVGDVNFFNNNKWHTINVRRTGPNIEVEVIDNQKIKYFVQDNLGDDYNLITYSHVNIGGARSPSLIQEHTNFIGWIQNLKFNNEELFVNYLNSRLPQWAKSMDGFAHPGENSLLLHHQITLTNQCPITLPRTSSSDKFNIHLFFKTSQENGVILFRRGKQYRFMALEIRDGKLRFVFDLGGGIKETTSTSILNDRNWHEVTIKRFDRQKFSLKIDDFKDLYIDIGTNSPPLSELESFTIGGLIPDHQKFEPHVLTTLGFIGCLASIEINHDAPNLYSNRLNLCPSVQHGCVDLACSSDTCANNGQCSALDGQVSCNCEMTSYTGPFCRDNFNYYFFGKNNKECGLIKYQLNPPKFNQETDKLAFGFTTIALDALLVRIEGDSQYLEIRLFNGYLSIIANFNNNEERFVYTTLEDKKFNDNTYHVVQFTREKSLISFRVDNFEQMRFTLQGSNCVFKNQKTIYVGSVDITVKKNPECYYGIITGLFWNSYYILDEGIQSGDVSIVDYRYIIIEIDVNRNRTRPLLPDLSCPLGYNKEISICIFSICPLNSDQIADTCSCYQGYHEIGNTCIKRNETRPAGVVGSSAKLIPAKAGSLETPLGLILGIISGIALALLAAGIGARKCSDGLCVPAARLKNNTSTANKVASMFASTTNTTNQSYELNTARREEVPLIQNNNNESKFMRQEEFLAKDTLDMGYNYFPQPVVTQSVNETMEMYEQTLGGAGGTTTVTTYGPTIAYNSSGLSQAAHHASHRDLAMSSMFFQQNNTGEYELSNVTCVTMTPNGKYAIIGQSAGTPQIWDTLSGQLIRSMTGQCSNCTSLSLACNGSLLVGLSNDGSSLDSPIQAVQIWEVQTGKPIQMSHQIKCCVFELSQDTNSIYMAGNQRFGRGISVGILDLITFELTKEVKSDPTLSLGDNPESIVITPDERHAIVGCRFPSGTNFVVFDLTKASEIAQTKSIAFDADTKCIAVLNNGEVITGTRGGHLIQWNIHTCQITTTYVDPSDTTAHLGPVNNICISGDKEHLVSGSSDGTVKVWNTINKSLVTVLSGHRGEVTCVSISNNDLIVSGSTDQTVALWRLFGGNQISSMPVGMNLLEVNMAKHNKTIVAIGEKDSEQQLLMLRVINVQR
ncbi:unnamed protein product [Brachionus calyciflorus]|uniref:Uncharacterized protein n=1 Tax=Brachionus calyciflorus TaxID=104777 RepID=A0A813MA39_9BILA|nr:unnamed protein product [Brachionus calyciflorus]